MSIYSRIAPDSINFLRCNLKRELKIAETYRDPGGEEAIKPN